MLEKSFREQFEINVLGLLEAQRLSPWRKGRQLYAFPDLFLSRFGEFPCQSLGLPLGEEILDDIIPSHEWVSRFYPHFHQNRCVLPEGDIQSWMEGKDLGMNPFEITTPGSIVLVEDRYGTFLGRGKITSDNQIKNLLPRRAIL